MIYKSLGAIGGVLEILQHQGHAVMVQKALGQPAKVEEVRLEAGLDVRFHNLQIGPGTGAEGKPGNGKRPIARIGLARFKAQWLGRQGDCRSPIPSAIQSLNGHVTCPFWTGAGPYCCLR